MLQCAAGNNELVALNHLAHAHWQLGNHELALGFVARGLATDAAFCDLHVRRLQLQASVANFTAVGEGRRRIRSLVSEQVRKALGFRL